MVGRGVKRSQLPFRHVFTGTMLVLGLHSEVADGTRHLRYGLSQGLLCE